MRHKNAVLAGVLALCASIHSQFVISPNDIRYHKYSGYPIPTNIKIDYVFREDSIIALIEDDSVFVMNDSGALAQSIVENWSVLKRRIPPADNGTICDGGGFQLASHSDTIEFSAQTRLNKEYDSATEAAIDKINGKIQILDEQFRSGNGSRIIDSLLLLRYYSWSESSRKQLADRRSSNDIITERLAIRSKRDCDSFERFREYVQNKYGTDFGIQPNKR